MQTDSEPPGKPQITRHIEKGSPSPEDTTETEAGTPSPLVYKGRVCIQHKVLEAVLNFPYFTKLKFVGIIFTDGQKR